MLRFFFTLAAVSGLTFLCLYVFRAELYAITEIQPATLGELYPVHETALAISAFETGAQGKPELTLTLNNAEDCAKWSLSGKDKPLNSSPSTLTLPLKPGTHDYVMQPLSCEITSPRIDAIRLNIFYGSADSPGFSIQNVATDQYQINSSNVRILTHAPSTFTRWVPNVEEYSPSEAQSARRYLADAGFDSTASTRDKIAFLVRLIRRDMPSGAPPPELNTISPWSVFTQRHESGLGNFCRQFSLSYGYLANLVGIPTRNVFTGAAAGTVDMGSHAFSESYVSEEARWAFVDPTNNIAYVQNADEEVLSGAEIYLASTTRTDEGLTAFHLQNGEVIRAPYASVSDGVRPFMHRDNFLIYIGWADGLYQMQGHGILKYALKLYRFLFQPKQYFGLSDFTSYAWLRPLSFFLCLVSSGFMLVFGFASLFSIGSHRKGL